MGPQSKNRMLIVLSLSGAIAVGGYLLFSSKDNVSVQAPVGNDGSLPAGGGQATSVIPERTISPTPFTDLATQGVDAAALYPEATPTLSAEEQEKAKIEEDVSHMGALINAALIESTTGTGNAKDPVYFLNDKEAGRNNKLYALVQEICKAQELGIPINLAGLSKPVILMFYSNMLNSDLDKSSFINDSPIALSRDYIRQQTGKGIIAYGVPLLYEGTKEEPWTAGEISEGVKVNITRQQGITDGQSWTLSGKDFVATIILGVDNVNKFDEEFMGVVDTYGQSYRPLTFKFVDGTEIIYIPPHAAQMILVSPEMTLKQTFDLNKQYWPSMFDSNIHSPFAIINSSSFGN